MDIENILYKLNEYIKKSNAAIYNPEKVGYKSGTNDELKCIGMYLSNDDDYSLAYNFMKGSVRDVKPFFESVKSNHQNSNPVIRRAIEIHLMNRG